MRGGPRLGGWDALMKPRKGQYITELGEYSHMPAIHPLEQSAAGDAVFMAKQILRRTILFFWERPEYSAIVYVKVLWHIFFPFPFPLEI
jgi:hypothetical protein